jgi:hypothetical protein
MGSAGYYKMLAVIFVILIFSVIVQGQQLFAETFFTISYAVMALALFIGTKWKSSSRNAFVIGLLLIFSVGFLSTNMLIEFFARPVTAGVFFKMAIVFSLDASALFFLNYGRKFRKLEGKGHRYGPYSVTGEPPEE